MDIGDIIYTVDQVSTQDLPLAKIVGLIKGPVDSMVTLMVSKPEDEIQEKDATQSRELATQPQPPPQDTQPQVPSQQQQMDQVSESIGLAGPSFTFLP